MTPFTDGDIIVHYQNGHVNAVYTRMEDRWSRAPGRFSVFPDEGWDDVLSEGMTGDEETLTGYLFVGNVRHLAQSLLASRA